MDMPETRRTAYKRVPSPTGGVDERLADMAWRFYEGDEDIPLTWLKCLGCGVTSNGDGSYTINGISGTTCGLMRSDPITVFVQFAFALAGIFWPQVYGGAQKLINDRWSAEAKRKKAKAAPPQEPPSAPPPEVPPIPKLLR